MKNKLLYLLALIWFFLQPLNGQVDFVIKPFATGLDKPVDIVHSTNDSLYIVERDGTIRIVTPDGSLGDVFLDIDDRVDSESSERGLLGLAFHPDYPDSAYIYVNYTGAGGDTYVSRFDVLSSTEADPDSEKVLLNIPQPFANHNAGDLVFGPDDYLYVALGDGGSGGDPGNRAQSLDEILGKILRIDVDNGDPYAIPPDNPFEGEQGVVEEIWVYGVRNPWRMHYDDISGGLYFGDVGQNSWEEVNFVPAAGYEDPNFGWRCYEANHTYDLSECDDVETVIYPIHEYPHTSAQNCSGSITGGVVYRGSDIPNLYGKYLYADFCNGQMGSIDVDNGYTLENLPDFKDFQISSFGTDHSGEMYLAALGEGIIYKFCPVPDYSIYSIDLDGSQAGTPSSGIGKGAGIFNAANSNLCVSGSFTNLSGNSTIGHVHIGQAGNSGDPVFDVDISPDSQSNGSFYGCGTLTNDELAALLNNGLYINIHSTAYMDGEIRGQLLLQICPGLYDLNVPVIPPGEYQAVEIISNGILESGNQLILKFEDSVLMNPGFQVETNAVLEVWMENCNGN